MEKLILPRRQAPLRSRVSTATSRLLSNKSTMGGVDISGINGNIELRLNDSVNANLEAHGMNGSVVSDLRM